jgi:DNA-directed RNA polymerase subunit beta'
MLREGKHPTDFFFTRMPILPPKYRTVTTIGDETNVAADANFLYKRMMDASDDLKAAKDNLPEEYQVDARESLYNAVNAVVGTMPTDDPKLEAKGVGGLLKWAFGKGSPKHSSAHRKIFGANLDMGGLGTITPDGDLSIDEVGIPEESAWKMFEPFVLRDLRQSGFSSLNAMREVMERTPEARRALERQMEKRPILINRAPTLWRYGIQGQYAKIVKDNSIHVNPNICKVFNADFDGDSMSTHVPVSNEAIEAIKENMLPSKNLISPQSGKAHFIPRDGANTGLYLASRIGKGTPVRFRTEEEAEEAYRKGSIKIDTPIEIG